MVTQLPFDAAAQVWLRAAGRGVTWFETRLEAGCRLPAARRDLGSYYKWPLALAACGRTELARQVLDVIVDDFMTVDGDFRSGDEKSGDPIYGLIADTYTNTWPIIAARVLERSDVAEAGLECLRRRHAPLTGGYLSGSPGQHADGRQDIVTIAGCGNAFLACGHSREAIDAGVSLLNILAAQEGPADPFCFSIDRFAAPVAVKTGWAAAALFRITGEREYLGVARQAAAEIVAAQRPEGDWADVARSDILECDAVGELCYHLCQYCLELASYRADRN